MLSVAYAECHISCYMLALNAECHYTECRGAVRLCLNDITVGQANKTVLLLDQLENKAEELTCLPISIDKQTC